MANMSNIFDSDVSKHIGPISSFAYRYMQLQLQYNSVMRVGSQVNDEPGTGSAYSPLPWG